MKNFLDLDFHHLGLATKDLTLSIKNLKLLGYKVESIKINKSYNVKNAVCISKKMPNIEIVSKIKETKSPIDNLLKKHENLIYHLCYISNNLKKTLSIFKKNKILFTRITKPRFSPFKNIYSSFFYIKGIGLVEIMDKSHKD